MGPLKPRGRPRTQRILGDRQPRNHKASAPRSLGGDTTMDNQQQLPWQHRQGWFSEGTVPGARFGTIEHAFRINAVVFEGRSKHQEVLIFDHTTYGRVLGYVRDTGISHAWHIIHVYLADPIMPRIMSKPRSGARLSACTTA
jgi:Spermidine synthase tetramerisation domain